MDGLTRRQREVALLVGAGFRNAEIGRRLGISDQTVKNHLTAIYERVGVRSRVQLAVLTQREGPPRGA